MELQIKTCIPRNKSTESSEVSQFLLNNREPKAIADYLNKRFTEDFNKVSVTHLFLYIPISLLIL